MKFKFYIRYPKWNADQNAGFTLIELLVATIIMSIVVTLAGTAFVGILQQNRKAESETQTRTNLNRALDYIANEIRSSNQVQAGTTGTAEVLRLTIPVVNTTTITSGGQTIIRYTQGTASTSTYSVANSTGVWQDPSDANSKSITRNGSFLVNGIKAPATSEITRISNNCPNPNSPNPNPNFLRSDGFYACLYPNVPGGTKVDLYLYGKLSPTGTMLVESTVYTRSRAFP